jgi:ribosomal protein S18 acetylase RimI-like enzyme
MSMYKEYIEETTDTRMLETDYGFATYITSFGNDGHVDCYIEDIYVKPEFRKAYEASKIAKKIEEIAKKEGCTRLLGSVNLNIKDPTRSIKVLLQYGFEVLSAGEGFIWFKKNL